jgi:RimJ/RimL family protein N-acetyltransferase
MSTTRKLAPGSALRIRSWRYRMSEHDLRQRVEVSDDGRTLATAEVTTGGSGGTAQVSLHAEPGHITPGHRASLVDAVLDLPEVQQSARLEAALRPGDNESLHRLQKRCQDGSTHPAGSSAPFKADLPSRRASRTSPAQPATSLWGHNDCMRPLRPPQGILTDGLVSLCVPSVRDVDAFVSYAAGQGGGLGGAWLPLPYAGASRERCLWMVADWLAGWAGKGSYTGPALLLTFAPSPEPVGMVGFVCGGAGTIELVLSVAPSWRGQGLATQAVLLAAGWLIRERGTDVVELRADRDSPACQRIAVKSGFPLAGTVSSVVEATGTEVEDLRYITEAGEQRTCHQPPIFDLGGQS